MRGKDSGVKVYDIECLADFFCYCDIDRDTSVKHTFIIHESLNQYEELLDYLLNNEILQVGFNNIGYDAQVIQSLISKKNIYRKLSGKELAEEISRISNEVIRRMNEKEKALYSPWYFKIPQLDLFKIWHYDNKARSTRLKDLQVAMKWKLVQDMPIHHTERVTADQIPMILGYCDNDILSTFEFYKLTREKVDLRITLNEEYGINVLNANDAKLGAEIFSKIIANQKGIDKYDLNQMRTYRESINLNDCILPFIKFKSKQFQKALDKFRSMTIYETKGALEFSVGYKGFSYDFGLGGIHGCTNAGIYKSNKTHVIKTCDVTSLYPSISIKHRFYPEHLTEEFVPIYEAVFLRRNDAKKKAKIDKTDKISKAINEGLKLALNGSYGKSNDKYSFFYDPRFTMQITVNGQLMLTMLAERLADAGFEILMINTDGLECIVPRDQVGIYDTICKEWEVETQLGLEFGNYDKMVIRDVNNYIAIPDKGEVKYKGCFEITKDYHKDPSFPIVAIALSEYFVKDVPFDKTIKSFPYEYTIYESGSPVKKRTDILDYAGRGKFKSDSYGEISRLDPDDQSKIKTWRQQKTTRYLVTKDGGIFTKKYYDGRNSFINKGYRCTEFNNLEYREFNEYNLDYRFYLNECRKIKDVVQPEMIQSNLF